jgi:hypothetical protein
MYVLFFLRGVTFARITDTSIGRSEVNTLYGTARKDITAPAHTEVAVGRRKDFQRMLGMTMMTMQTTTTMMMDTTTTKTAVRMVPTPLRAKTMAKARVAHTGTAITTEMALTTIPH